MAEEKTLFKLIYYQILDDWYDLPILARIILCWLWFLFPLVLLVGFVLFKNAGE